MCGYMRQLRYREELGAEGEVHTHRFSTRTSLERPIHVHVHGLLVPDQGSSVAVQQSVLLVLLREEQDFDRIHLCGQDLGDILETDGSRFLHHRTHVLGRQFRVEDIWGCVADAVEELRRIYEEYKLYLPLYQIRATEPPKAPPQEVYVAELEARRAAGGKGR